MRLIQTLQRPAGRARLVVVVHSRGLIVQRAEQTPRLQVQLGRVLDRRALDKHSAQVRRDENIVRTVGDDK